MIITAFIFAAPLCVLLYRKAGGGHIIPVSQVRTSQEHNGLLLERPPSGPGTEALSQHRESRGALCLFFLQRAGSVFSEGPASLSQKNQEPLGLPLGQPCVIFHELQEHRPDLWAAATVFHTVSFRLFAGLPACNQVDLEGSLAQGFGPGCLHSSPSFPCLSPITLGKPFFCASVSLSLKQICSWCLFIVGGLSEYLPMPRSAVPVTHSSGVGHHGETPQGPVLGPKRPSLVLPELDS